jgi:3-methylcrotonyl-CoA carboxylase alpha subunit
MNTRLQVEHPVTELIAGVDLVEWQLRVAFGEILPMTQDQIRLNGHAIEARVYAENPDKNFMPSVGRIKTWRTPRQADGLRIDAGYREGDTVSPNYDAMLAKVIAWAPTRDVAIDRLNRGLEETDVRGIVTNVPFLSALVTHPQVRANAIDTGFIERELAELTARPSQLSVLEQAACIAAILQDEQPSIDRQTSPWRTDGWMMAGTRQRSFQLRSGGSEHNVVLRYAPGSSTLLVDDSEIAFASTTTTPGELHVTLDGVQSRVVAVVDSHEIYVRTRNGRFEVHWVDPFGMEDEEQAGADRVVAPLPGTVVALLVEEGAAVEKGAAIVTLEVMKMEQTLRAPYAGTVTRLKCKVGDIVQEGVELAEIEAAQS